MIVLPKPLVGELLTLLDESTELLEVHQRSSDDTDLVKKTSGLIGRLKSHKHKLEEQAKEKPETTDPGQEPIYPKALPLEDEEDLPMVCVECGAGLKTPSEWVAMMCAKCSQS